MLVMLSRPAVRWFGGSFGSYGFVCSFIGSLHLDLSTVVCALFVVGKHFCLIISVAFS